MTDREIPAYVEDWQGNKIQPGNFILYATVSGSTAIMNEAMVLGFKWNKTGSQMLKMEVQQTRTNGWGLNQSTSLLHVKHNATYTKVWGMKNWEVC